MHMSNSLRLCGGDKVRRVHLPMHRFCLHESEFQTTPNLPSRHQKTTSTSKPEVAADAHQTMTSLQGRQGSRRVLPVWATSGSLGCTSHNLHDVSLKIISIWPAHCACYADVDDNAAHACVRMRMCVSNFAHQAGKQP